jgi:hypothetical protein
MTSFILGFLNHQEADDEEQVAIGLILCAKAFGRSGTPSHVAAAEFLAGLEALRADNNSLN